MFCYLRDNAPYSRAGSPGSPLLLSRRFQTLIELHRPFIPENSRLKYISTRGGAESQSLAQLLTRGTASDGGLFVPSTWPAVDSTTLETLLDGEYADIATRILHLFGGDTLPDGLIKNALQTAMAKFDDPVGPPINALGDGLWTMELMHGPTLAFKDFALAPLGEIIDHTLQHHDQRATVLCATSGDTGAATVSAFANRARLNAVVLYPDGGVSEFQRRQMTTTGAANVLPLCINGDFDECQKIVKSLYQTEAAKIHGYTAVNSINIVRILLQSAYYLRTSGIISRKTGKACNFVVPTGNFGNIYAAYIAKQLGAPVGKLIVTSNDNDVLPRLFDTSTMSGNQTVKTISPSMDIQVSSNFERLLWHVKNKDGAAVRALQDSLEADNQYQLSDAEMSQLQTDFTAFKCTESEALTAIKKTWDNHKKIICPHSATAFHAATKAANALDGDTVIVETAHPAKFADAVYQAIGVHPELPASAVAMLEAKEIFTSADASAHSVQAAIDKQFSH